MAIILLILVVLGLAVALIFLVRGKREEAARQWLANRKTTLIKILVPKNNEKTPAATEHLFAALHGIYRPQANFQEYLSFEIAANDNAIEFYVNCPTDLKDFIEGQIYAQYPSVEIQEVADYARLELGNSKVASAELTLNKPDVFPIKTFVNFEVDPLAGITAVLSKIGENEHIWIQTLVRPVSDAWQNKGIGYVAAVRSGNLSRSSLWRMIFKGLIDLFSAPTVSAPAPAAPVKLPAPQEAALKAIETKVTKLGYETKMRIVVIASDETVASAKINGITGAFKQFNTVNINGFSAAKISLDVGAIEQYKARYFWDKGIILNIEELASVYHFPNATVETPNIVWAGAKKGESPSSLPVEGIVAPEDLTLFGITDFRGARQRFGIKLKDRRQHMYAIGKSGTGKSTLLENMAIDDIRKGRGVAIVDPHGDFVNHVLEFIPASRANDVIYFNPADRDYPVGFNVLENVDPELKNIVASGVVGIFKKLFAESWGPRLEYILRNVVLALLEYPGATMLGVMRILVNKRFREQVMNKVKDPVIRDFFINEYEKYDPKFRTEAIAPIQNKVGQFLAASTIRNIVGQPQSTFDIEDAMNSRKILLLDLSIGKIGEDAAALLGSMMITKIQLAAMRRASIPEDERVDFYLYVDEFQNFATESFATILSEARKYHLNLIMTNQYIAQLREEVAKAVFGNIGTLITFRVGASDSVALVKEYEPVFDANDLINLNNHHIYAKMSIDGVTRPAFSAITLPPATDKNNNRDKIIRISRERYSSSRELVEQKIMDATTDDNSVSSDSRMTVGRIKDGSAVVAESAVVKANGQIFNIREDKKGSQWYFGQEIKDSKVLPGTNKSSAESVQTASEKTEKTKDNAVESSKIAGDKAQPVDAKPDIKKYVDEKPKEEPPKKDAKTNQPKPEPKHEKTQSLDKPKGESQPAVNQVKSDKQVPPAVKTIKPGETIVLRD